ncbi:MAG: ester cyclase [Mangrovicoccus sp.]
MTTIHDKNKAALQPFLNALYDYDKTAARRAAAELFEPAAPVQLCHPFNKLTGQSALLEAAILPLAQSFLDFERRDQIIVAGEGAPGRNWVGCCGYYIGTFMKPWLCIPPSRSAATMRYHEFFRFENGRVVEVKAIWDIPDLMMQTHCWPMSPSLGREWLTPSPATQDGLTNNGDGEVARAKVESMLKDLARFGEEGVEGMQLSSHLHPHCMWYGPSGIGSARGIDGFRRWHQIPFLKAMPERKVANGGSDLFAEGNYAAMTDWPSTSVKLSGDGWLGIAPSGQELTIRGLEFWRIEKDMIRETWCLVDLLDVYNQLGVDVLGRMQELTGQVADAAIGLN